MSFPQPNLTEISRLYWDALSRGELHFQKCASCGNAWLPPRDACPACLSPDSNWVRASGKGKLVSWIVYHQAYAPAFEARLPYNVAIVELDEGPRLLTNILSDAAELSIGAPVTLQIEREGDLALARFALDD